MKRILFVDDEPMVLDGLRRMLRGMRKEWEMEFAESGPEALRILDNKQFNVIVTDMRMPGMDGYQLLNFVKDRHPQVVRIILSGHSDREMVLTSIGPIHQFLAKPCDAETLKATVTRVSSMRDLLEDEALIRVVSGIESLPSLPKLYCEVMDEVSSEEASLDKVGEIISRDAGMSTKILQLVNSAFFGLPRHITSPVRAVHLLGLETVKSLVLSVKIFSMFSLSDLAGYSIDELFRHSLAVGLSAKNIAILESWEQEKIDEAFMAGLLHDVGKLILAEKFPAQCRKVIERIDGANYRIHDAELDLFGTTHAQVGAYLLGIWGLSEPIIQTTACHHTPDKSPSGRPDTLTAVYVANIFESKSWGEWQSLTEPDTEYLEKLGIADRFEIWRQLCQKRQGEQDACQDSICR
jgi:HD-like signal output (HDOD) protein/ActR/RegA family two-component response regulator